MSDQAHGPGQDIDQQGSMVAGSSRPGLTSAQKVGIAGLLLVVFLAFIWISALRKPKSGDSALQADATFSSGQDFRTPPPAAAPAPPDSAAAARGRSVPGRAHAIPGRPATPHRDRGG